MTAAVLVAQLRARGLRLRVEGETLLVSPPNRLKADDRACLRGRKAAVLAVLEAEAAEPAVALALDVLGATVVRCPRCGGDRWKPDLTGEGERCTTCGAWSSCSLPLDGPLACGPRGAFAAAPLADLSVPQEEPAQTARLTSPVDHEPTHQG